MMYLIGLVLIIAITWPLWMVFEFVDTISGKTLALGLIATAGVAIALYQIDDILTVGLAAAVIPYLALVALTRWMTRSKRVSIL